MPLQSCLLNRHTCLGAGPLPLHVATPTAQAAPADQPPPVSSAFIQAGLSQDARIYVFGASRDWGKPLQWRDAAGYWESSIGKWRTRHAPEGDRGALVTQVGAMRPATERSRFHSVEGRRRARARMLYAVVMLVALVSASFTVMAHDDSHCARKQSPWIA
jgi:hypothetical protein